jgi:hypothetical protein
MQSECSHYLTRGGKGGWEGRISGMLTGDVDLSKHLGPWHVQVSRCLVELDIDGPLRVEELQAKFSCDWALDNALLPVHLAVVHTPCKRRTEGVSGPIALQYGMPSLTSAFGVEGSVRHAKLDLGIRERVGVFSERQWVEGGGRSFTKVSLCLGLPPVYLQWTRHVRIQFRPRDEPPQRREWPGSSHRGSQKKPEVETGAGCTPGPDCFPERKISSVLERREVRLMHKPASPRPDKT